LKSYRCPEADKDMHRTYIMSTPMNAWCDQCYPPGASAFVSTRIGQIKKSGERIVFFEEKEISPDAFIFSSPVDASPYAFPAWKWDFPNIMHGDGANFGFADGHADYHKWEGQETLTWIKSGWPATSIPNCSTSTKACNDLKWMGNAIWGVMK
jgi:prepilin-type processing-associated H-X9-DG protein